MPLGCSSVFPAVFAMCLAAALASPGLLRGWSSSAPRSLAENPCTSCSACVKTDPLNLATDEECRQCANDAYQWWPCNEVTLCKCDSSSPTLPPTPAPPTTGSSCPAACSTHKSVSTFGVCTLCVSEWGWCGSTSVHCSGQGTDCSQCQVETTAAPTDAPTAAPTEGPTDVTIAPTDAPTAAPMDAPTPAPSEAPTHAPTAVPTDAPTMVPTDVPTLAPTGAPTDAPTVSPTTGPTCPEACSTHNSVSSFGVCTQCVSEWGWCGSTSDHCNSQGTDCSQCRAGSGTTAAPTPVPTPGPPTLAPTAGPPTPAPTLSPTQDASVCSATGPSCDFTPGEGVSSWFTKELFDEMFPNICSSSCHGCEMLQYKCLIKATLSYTDFAASSSVEDNKRELAAWLGEMSQETTGGGCGQSTENPDGTCSCGPMWCDQETGGCEAWGLCFVEEASGQYCSPGSTYPCTAGKEYKGRGPKQLSWNYNYGQFSEEFCGDKSILLDNPDWVASNPTLAWASSMWFWFTGGACLPGESCKPSCHDVFLGRKPICVGDMNAGRQYGLGWVTNVINGGLECGGAGEGKCDSRVHSRVKYYKRFCEILDVNPLADGWTDDENLFCHNQDNYANSPPPTC